MIFFSLDIFYSFLYQIVNYFKNCQFIPANNNFANNTPSLLSILVFIKTFNRKKIK